MKKIFTLLIIHKDNQVLLGLKKMGFGAGNFNGFGGKVEEGEIIEEAAKRELFEEAKISVEAIEKIGIMEFSWKEKLDEILEVHIFKATEFTGQPQETEEMKPQWFDIDKIPFEKMWPDDEYWFPLFLENKKFSGKFMFDKNNVILEYELHESSRH